MKTKSLYSCKWSKISDRKDQSKFKFRSLGGDDFVFSYTSLLLIAKYKALCNYDVKNKTKHIKLICIFSATELALNMDGMSHMF